MWKYIVGIITLALIECQFEIDPYQIIKLKRKKRLKKSIVYLALTCISFLLYISHVGGEDWKNFLLVMSVASALFAVGSLLSAINPNLREIFATVVIYAVLASAIYVWLKDSHFIWFCILEGFFALSVILNSIEAISDMRAGIDPDVVEADKEAKKKSRKKLFKIAKLLFRSYHI